MKKSLIPIDGSPNTVSGIRSGPARKEMGEVFRLGIVLESWELVGLTMGNEGRADCKRGQMKYTMARREARGKGLSTRDSGGRKSHR